MSDIKKKSIVWYFDTKLKEWHRGKVIAVNRWGLTIKKRHGRGIYFLSPMQTAILASDPKPTYIPPLNWTELEKERELFKSVGWYYGTSKKARLLQRLGLLR